MSQIFHVALQDAWLNSEKRHEPFETAIYRASYQHRLQHLERTGEHLPLVSLDAWRSAWRSVYTDQGASPDLIQMIRKGLSDWLPTSRLPDKYASMLAAAEFSVGDRFDLNLDAVSSNSYGISPNSDDFLPYDIYAQAINLPPDAEGVLALARSAIVVSLPANEKLLETLVRHKRDVVGVISEPRSWKASGELNYARVRKQLVDKVSSAFQEWYDSQMGAVCEIWRDTASRPIGVSTAAKGRSFESDIAQLFQVAGFNVELTPDSGDFGVDLIVSHGNHRLAVQAKDWASSAGVDAVQQVAAGSRHYQCNDSLVISRNGFTEAAQALARSTNTKLETIESIRRKMRHVLCGLSPTN